MKGFVIGVVVGILGVAAVLRLLRDRNGAGCNLGRANAVREDIRWYGPAC